LSNFERLSFSTDVELARCAAEQWLRLVAQSNSRGEKHLVALSGGRITKAFFAALTDLAPKLGIRLDQVHFFWADERCVPPTDPESNFAMADQLLFRPLKIHPGQIHRLRGETEPQVAVESAIFELNALAPKSATGTPMFDVIFLGMGEDGHVASLFPNASAEVINCPAPFLHIDNSPKPPLRRISLSYQTLAAAREVWTLISGAGKEKAFQDSIAGMTPLGRVLQQRNHTKLWVTGIAE
jgi:6-phosphogluconolactonase